MNTHLIDKQTAKILVVDDTIDSLRLLANMLSEQGYNVRKVLNGQMALTAAQTAPPDLILLDITMPQMNGYEVCQHLKSQEKTAEIPVIFISALDEVLDKVKAFTVGGVDYITKPYQFEEVIARVETQLTIRFLQQKLSEIPDNSDIYQSQYQRLFDYSIAGTFQITPDGYYQNINSALAQIYGYESPEHMISESLDREGLLYQDQNRWSEIMTILAEQETLSNCKSQVCQADGNLIWICENIWTVRDQQGKLCYYEGTVISGDEK